MHYDYDRSGNNSSDYIYLILLTLRRTGCRLDESQLISQLNDALLHNSCCWQAAEAASTASTAGSIAAAALHVDVPWSSEAVLAS